MKVTVFGSGYVGLVTGTCLANVGNRVCCVDVDAAKIARLQRGMMISFFQSTTVLGPFNGAVE